jgi:processive 1,2-diacylglycerol beta-glucosyltransferase
MGGSRGWGIKPEDIEELLQVKYEIQLVIVVGADEKRRRGFTGLTRGRDVPVKVFGFLPSRDLARLFQAAKILVTKPGGSTLGEALASNLPMVLTNPLPAMEELNQEFMVGQGAAFEATTPKEVRLWVERLLQDKRLYEETRKHLKAFAKPEAANLAAQAIIDTLRE